MSPFPSHHSLHSTDPHLPPGSYPPLALSMCPLYMFLDDPFPFFLCYLPPCPSGYCKFLFQWLWLYFACLFVLLVTFPLKVRSHGIWFIYFVQFFLRCFPFIICYLFIIIYYFLFISFIIFPYCWFSFHFADVFFSHAKVFLFWWIPICLFFPLCPLL